MRYKKNWEVTQTKWQNYWKQQNVGRPLMHVIAKKDDAQPLPVELECRDVQDKYQCAERMVARYRHYCENHEFLAESFPNMSADFGPGSVAAYLGANIVFNPDTIWYEEFVEDWSEIPRLDFNEKQPWFQRHYELVKRCKELAKDDFYIGIPDLIENIDILASMRGAQDTIFDLIDEPDEIKARIAEITKSYFEYYNRFYDLVKDEEGGACYTVFQIWALGKIAKIQCDFSAMLSPDQFREFVQDSIKEQARSLDYVLYHLDGPDAIRHMDALMEIEEINALQWTSGDHGPDGTLEEWYSIYDKARAAGKSLWIKVYSGGIEDWIKGVDRLVDRYGSSSLFLHFPEMSMEEARRLLDHAEKYWSDRKGSFK